MILAKKRGGAEEACLAHDQNVGGSKPSPSKTHRVPPMTINKCKISTKSVQIL